MCQCSFCGKEVSEYEFQVCAIDWCEGGCCNACCPDNRLCKKHQTYRFMMLRYDLPDDDLKGTVKQIEAARSIRLEFANEQIAWLGKVWDTAPNPEVAEYVRKEALVDILSHDTQYWLNTLPYKSHLEAYQQDIWKTRIFKQAIQKYKGEKQ